MPFPGPNTYPGPGLFPGTSSLTPNPHISTGQREVTTPHLSVPFKFGGLNGSAFVNEQDSDADIVDCIKAILAYPIGSREDLPPFGRPDIVFTETSTEISNALRAAVARWEPRAEIGSREFIDLVDHYKRAIVIQARGLEHG